MEIQVLGSGCTGCKILFETVQQAVAELGITATVVKEEDFIKIMAYNVMQLPGLVIDGQLVSSGKKLSVEQIKTLLTK